VILSFASDVSERRKAKVRTRNAKKHILKYRYSGRLIDFLSRTLLVPEFLHLSHL